MRLKIHHCSRCDAPWYFMGHPPAYFKAGDSRFCGNCGTELRLDIHERSYGGKSYIEKWTGLSFSLDGW